MNHVKIDPLSTYRFYICLKNAFNGKYDINKKGVTKFKAKAEHLQKSYVRYHIEKFTDTLKYQDSILKVFAANLVRDPSADITKFRIDADVNITKYNSSLEFYKDETKDIFRKYQFRDLLNKNDTLLLRLLSSGEISPEWFALTSRVLPITEILDEQNSFLWLMLKDRLTAYRFFVTIKNTEKLEELKTFIQTCIFST